MDANYTDKGDSAISRLVVSIGIFVAVFIAAVAAFFVINLIKHAMIGTAGDFRGMLMLAAYDTGMWSVRAAYASVVLPLAYWFEGIHKRDVGSAVRWYAKAYFGVVTVIILISMMAGSFNHKPAINQGDHYSQATKTSDEDVMAEIRKIPELFYWSRYDAEKFNYAISVDDELKMQPYWRNRPLGERFKKVTEMTMNHFGM